MELRNPYRAAAFLVSMRYLTGGRCVPFSRPFAESLLLRVAVLSSMSTTVS